MKGLGTMQRNDQMQGNAMKANDRPVDVTGRKPTMRRLVLWFAAVAVFAAALAFAIMRTNGYFAG